ncbi:pantetheine-phosphate adenylyltransferase [Ligilactobacillus salivarius]|uniref:Phosphopantetheine adenylyltransferase n=1 Tax=Ligilactobacillus salivarius TaxID=1624 RepID=A0AB36MIL2_9LACO|nr:pantetheine-phosphate adenylyltransferase [Ligilactobacillus salivarius]MDN4848338.1 pantetheine-phosphate adenylyltransferase [Ligilactobacillus salivarius]OUN19095.1 pantetheine-phosphate adenylyltransferase [Ligilactobacillus salivarius]
MKVIFPGSFDPITNGHMDLISRASKLFDQVVVVISNNTSKHSLFTSKEKYHLVTEALSKFSNVSVELIQTDLTINVVKKFNADAIIRGIRNTRDFTYEQEIALMNKKLDSDIETITLFSNPEVSFISSTLVREISQFNLDKLVGTVPDNVIEALRKKVKN